MSNLKQIGLAFFQYTQDYDEKFPFVTCNDLDTASSGCSNTVASASPWYISLQPYMKSYQILTCPSDSVAGNAADERWLPGYVHEGVSGLTSSSSLADMAKAIPLSYSTNINLGGSLSLAAINSPAQLFLVTETGEKSSPTTYIGSFYTRPGYDPGERWKHGSRHFDGRNWLFSDGHAKWLRDVGGYSVETDIKNAFKSRGVFGEAGD